MFKLIIFAGFLILRVQCKVLTLDTLDIEYESFLPSSDDPPPHTDYAKMVRWLVHNVEWTAMGTISTLPSISGFPMVNVIAFADSEKKRKINRKHLLLSHYARFYSPRFVKEKSIDYVVHHGSKPLLYEEKNRSNGTNVRSSYDKW